MTPKRGLFLTLLPLRGVRNGGICRILAILHITTGGTLALGVYLPCTMVREIFLRSRSTFSTHTLTVSPTRTTSLGCLTKRLASLEMCTRPSWCTPTSTKAPKSTTLRTVPLSSMPGSRSSMESAERLKTTSGASSRGSRPGFLSSLTMSMSVRVPQSRSLASAEMLPRRRSISGTPPRLSSLAATPARSRTDVATS